MGPRERLASTRSAFIQAFEQTIQHIVPAAVESLYAKAMACDAGESQQQVFQARALLQERRDSILTGLMHEIRRLLERSTQTAYHSYRPPSALNSTQLSDLSLLDQSDFEHSLRFNSITQRFRHNAGQELIDLNIRIAVLFGQDDISERENPFRPYLLVQAISSAVNQLSLPEALTGILTAQIGESMSERVQELYRAANVDLAMQGIEAHLSLKINKSQDVFPARVFPGDTAGNAGTAAAYHENMMTAPVLPASDGDGFPELMVRPPIRIGQLFDSLRGVPNPPLQAEIQAAHPPVMQAAVPAESDLPWLNHGVDLGQMMRSVLGVAADVPVSQRAAYRTGAAAFPVSTARPQGQAANAGSAHELSAATQSLIGQLAELVRSVAVQAPAQQALPTPAARMTLEQALGQMHKYLAPDASEMLAEDGGIRNLIREQRDVLFDLAGNEQDQMTIDVVAMLFEAIGADALPDPAFKQQLGRLQFLFLQLAIMDSNFLLSGTHAARQLFNRIASALLSKTLTAPMQAQFEEEAGRIFKTLARHDCTVPGLFERIYTRFDTFITRELRNFDKSVRRSVKSIEEAQIRCLQELQTAELIRQGAEGLDLPSHFQNFLMKDWVRAISMAERRDPQFAAQCRALVPDLIWSLQPKQSEEERTQLEGMLQPLSNGLRQGIYLLGWNHFKMNALFNWLIEAHNKARKPSPDMPAGPSLQELRSSFAEFVSQSISGLAGVLHREQYPLIRPYLNEVLSELGLSARFLEAGDGADKPASDAIPVWTSVRNTDVADITGRYYGGLSFDIQFENILRRGCICWVNPNSYNLVLLLSDIHEPVIADLQEFHARTNIGQIQLLEKAPLFDRAILTLLRSADELDHASANG